ncbi:hypothetical protein [Flammeovirga sp. SJP92]|uniref:hypothetical protein n=1 Tax=Flammeovirga sp. SJP92 TaxID=1775430 RepID=UPI0007893216|nr:hypothetical protein [Flammeovirga sp. SJP92]KXX69472.1 hypothetical protein AVL50_19160 [Flammeovirga sp. SJP92]
MYGDNEFGEFSLDKGSRSINEILIHVIEVLDWATEQITNKQKEVIVHSEFELLVNEFIKKIDQFEMNLSDHQIDIDLTKKLIQGPLSDILTHIGQIAMLSRLNDKPIEKEDFSEARIKPKMN